MIERLYDTSPITNNFEFEDKYILENEKLCLFLLYPVDFFLEFGFRYIYLIAGFDEWSFG